MPSDTWKSDLLPRLIAKGLTTTRLERSVYVIRLNGNFVIEYPRGDSPTVYVGEGSFASRIAQHKAWSRELEELVGKFAFELCVAAPRVTKQPDAYRDCEAAILLRFGHRFGSTPLWNKRFQKRRFSHHEYTNAAIDKAIGKRSGAKFEWALRPLKSSSFYESYHRNHLAGDG